MRLSDFMRANSAQILAAWDEMAASLVHEGGALDKKTLRDHGAEILLEIADQVDGKDRPARGERSARAGPADTAAETHAEERKVSGFAIDTLVTEYRALRSGVLRLWVQAGGNASGREALQDLIRFDDAIDQAIAESVTRYARQTQRATDMFIGILGHDIRNPLGTIQLSVEYLQRAGSISAAQAAPIRNATARIGSIIGHIIDFTRTQIEGMLHVKPQEGDLGQCLLKVVEETRVLHPQQEIAFSAEGDLRGQWDEGRMGQLLSNLLGNAIDYGTAAREIKVRVWDTGEGVALTVHNYGPAIPPQDQETIFRPLVRGRMATDEDARTRGAGLGLGLYICQQIALAHSGSITVKTEDGGTTFEVQLPKRQPAPAGTSGHIGNLGPLGPEAGRVGARKA